MIDPNELLPDVMLERFRQRAAGYDERNEFFWEDLEELKSVGYLGMFAKYDAGGLGYGLQQAAAAQRRLATAAPATALAINMHLVWTGVAHLLHEEGDDSLFYVLEEAAQGEVFAFGNSEAGNDSVLFDSQTVALPHSDGSYSFTGTKIFTSLSPAWTRLGIFGKDSTGEEERLVHAFITRDTPGYSIRNDWNTLGMRASQSCTTDLQGATAPPERVFRKLPVGPNADPLIFAIFACFETLLAAVYTGIGERALEIGVATVKKRFSKKSGKSYSQDPDIRWRFADAALAIDGLLPQLDSLARDIDNKVDHGQLWFPKMVGLKIRATETARDVVDKMIRVSGGGSYFAGNELGRLYRDVLAGIFHPSDDESAHATVASAWLGPLED